MTGIVLRIVVVALGLWLAAEVLPGLWFAGAGTLLAAALLLGVVNAIVRPIAILLTLPLTLITLGLFLLVVNAGMLGLVALMLGGFQVNGFWTAIGASLIVSAVSWLASGLLNDKGKVEVMK
ncbi:MAG TPA: phage holin family protein, partial [Steroidobacteraceae bacterium]|nr:phage holin family protein [Steroidobacteraceae bacterium]